MNKKVEVLAPAGSFESLKAAVAAGADACYMGGSRFGARAYADNPDDKLFLEALDYAHIHGCRIYMTVNTLIKEKELPDVYGYLLPLYERGLDAVLVQDMGVFSYIRRNFPKLPVHVSTQMTVTGSDGSKLMTELGASRVVLAREVSLEEIKKIRKETGAELETFVHGALCYSYSGQCLASSLIGGRSGNRGRCAQTCRLPFDVFDEKGQVNKKNERYCLSLKDLCSLDLLPDIIDAGVFSLKIEGRMKSPRYTAGVVSIYRKYVDRYLEYGRSGYYVEPEDRKSLLDLFDRGGQSEGYYKVHNGRDMVVRKEKPEFREENRELSLYLDTNYVNAKVKEPVNAYAYIHEGEEAVLTYSYYNEKTGVDVSATVTGAIVEKAQNQPMSDDRLKKQLSKTGDSEFRIEAFTIDTEGAVFMPVQELNDLRRRGLEALKEEILNCFRREPVPENTDSPESVPESRTSAGKPAIHVTLERPEVLTSAIEALKSYKAAEPGSVQNVIGVDAASFSPENWSKTVENVHKGGALCYLIMPHIWRTEAIKWFDDCKQKLIDAGFDGLVVRAWEEIPVVKKLVAESGPKALKVLMDFNIYTMNREAESFIRGFCEGLDVEFTWPVELNYHELMERKTSGGELFAYGALPMMVSAQCVRKTMLGCSKKPQVLMMKDRKGKEFPVENHCRFCYSTMLNSDPVSLIKEKERVGKLAPERIRLQFTTEDAARTVQVIKAFGETFVKNGEAVLAGDFTNGHFKRGVE